MNTHSTSVQMFKIRWANRKKCIQKNTELNKTHSSLHTQSRTHRGARMLYISLLYIELSVFVHLFLMISQ